MGYTITEKILGQHARKKVKAGDAAVCKVDFCFSQDGTSELVIDSFQALGKKDIFAARRFGIVIDHSAPSPRQAISNIHQKLRKFAGEQGALLFDVGSGVCHQVIPEAGLVLPGSLVVGADSHTCTYGALNAFACGLGSTDIAVVLACGKSWFRVPKTVKILITGKIPGGISAKDIILSIIGKVRANGCTYKAIEFSGPVVEALSMDGRFTISNMVVEMGAKCGLFCVDRKTIHWLKRHTKRNIRPVGADQDATYEALWEFDVSRLSPQIACPHSVDNVVNVEKVEGTKIDVAYLGTCTNGRLEDLVQGAKILAKRQIHPDVNLLIAPASRDIYITASQMGILEQFSRQGALVLPPGCGPCVGTHGGIPADNQVVLSSANRNFKGRMGNPHAAIFLASPLTVVASSIEGKITDPRKYLRSKRR